MVNLVKRLGFISGLTLPAEVARRRHRKSTPNHAACIIAKWLVSSISAVTQKPNDKHAIIECIHFQIIYIFHIKYNAKKASYLYVLTYGDPSLFCTFVRSSGETF